MKVYGKVGFSDQQIGGSPENGWVAMACERPEPEMVASESGDWVAPRPPDPEPVSRYQLREAMRLTRYHREGSPGWTLFDAFEELLKDPGTPAYYRRPWDEMQVFGRASVMWNAAADVLGLTTARRDDVFRLAATLKA